MGWIDDVALSAPRNAREPLSLVLMGVLLVTVSNAVLEIGFIRHRWRLVLFVSRISGLAAGFLFIAWPCDLLFIPQALSMINTFVDPRFHMVSLARNPSRVWAVNGFLGALFHHAAGAKLLANICSQVLNVSPRPTPLALPAPILVAILCEVIAWVVDIQVILRSAPRWFWYLSSSHMVVQVVALVISLLYSPMTTDEMITIIATTIGNTFLFLGFVTGKGASTHERLSKDKLDVQSSMHPPKSAARRMHADNPLKEDRSVTFSRYMSQSEGNTSTGGESPAPAENAVTIEVDGKLNLAEQRSSRRSEVDFASILTELSCADTGAVCMHTRMPFTR